MKKRKILYFVDSLEIGGIQSMLINWIKKIDKKNFEIEFLILDYGYISEIEKELKTSGITIHRLNGIWINNPVDFIRYIFALNNFFKMHHNYDVVHMHSSSKNYLVLKYAKKYNIPIRIAHSHSTNFSSKNKVKKFIGNILKRQLKVNSTDFFACSEVAGNWLFGNNNSNKNFQVIKNAIDYDKYKYNEKIRNKIRKDLNIKDDTILFGHVGRFVPVKNHKYLIDVFFEYYKVNNNSKLILIGDGPLKEELNAYIKLLGINESVIFTGLVRNVNDYFQAMDMFIFPSLYEGLPMVLVEAQASGISCLVSDKVSPEAKLSESFHFFDINMEPKNVVSKINELKFDRNENYETLKNNGYILENIITNLESIYKQVR